MNVQNNLRLAKDFIQSNGTPVEIARLRYLLDGEQLPAPLVEELLAGQRLDGGWAPFWAEDYSALNAVCARLAQAEGSGIAASQPAIQRALASLARRQRVDGSWEEDISVASFAPPWALPGDLAARLYLTANCGFWQAILGQEHFPPSLAAKHISEYLDPGGRLPSYLHAHWLAAGLWLRLGWDEPAKLVLGYLSTSLPEMHPSNLAWMLTSLRIAGLPASHSLIQAAASRLQDCQAPDGHWPSEDGPLWDISSTLEALRALKLCFE
jgi:hypothetical protein